LIVGLISRADRVFFPTDCISHDAVAAIKRQLPEIPKELSEPSCHRY
jgi:hypothetical protein